jgi:hypothetical protein
MKNLKNSLIIASALLAATAFGASTTSLNPTNTTSTSLGDKFWKNIKKNSSFSHFSLFSGPGLTNISTETIDSDGNKDGGQINSWHQVSYRYKINDNFKFVLNPRFNVEYGRDPEGANKEGEKLDSNYQILNPVVGIAGTWYQNGNLKISGGLNTMFVNVDNTDGGAIDDRLVANPGGFQTINYKVNSKLDVGTWVWFRKFFFEKNVNNEENFKSTTSPYINYTVNDKVAFQAWYDTSFNNINKYGPDHLRFESQQGAGVGMHYSFNKYVNIFPNIAIQPDNAKVDTTTLNAWLYGSF